jgi:hypothetical protein
MATRTAQLAFLVVKFMPAARAPAPVFALHVTGSRFDAGIGSRNRRDILFFVSAQLKNFGYWVSFHEQNAIAPRLVAALVSVANEKPIVGICSSSGAGFPGPDHPDLLGRLRR